MIVADTCIVVHLFNETNLTSIAQKVLEKDSHWLLPLLWQEEYANVLAKLARKERKPAQEIIKHFNHTCHELKNFEVQVSNEKALKVSIELNLSVYDAHFVCLAFEHGTVLITEDKEVLKRCPHAAINMLDFLSLSR